MAKKKSAKMKPAKNRGVKKSPTHPGAAAIPMQFPIEWEVGNTPSLFANHLIAQGDDHEFHLSFFDIQPPLIYGTEEQKKAQVDKIKSVPARCVARIVISQDRLVAFVGVMQAVLHGMHVNAALKAAQGNHQAAQENVITVKVNKKKAPK